MNSPFLTPSVTRLLQQVASGPTPDPSPEGQRAALRGAISALGYPAPCMLPQPEKLSTGASLYRFEPTRTFSSTRIVYLHGGSFLAGDIRAHGGVTQALADTTGASVAFVDYRLAPEHLLPAAQEDCIAGATHVAQDGPIVLVGDSAGGWLAIQSAIALQKASAGSVERLVLVNPMTGPRSPDEGTMREYAQGYFAAANDFTEAWRIAGGTQHRSADFEGREADLMILPPTFVITNEADPVRDQGEELAERLSALGVTALSLRLRGLVHAAWLFPQSLPEARLVMKIVAGAAALL